MTDLKMIPGTPCNASEEETLRTIRAVLTEDNAIVDREPNLLRRAFVDRSPTASVAPRRRRDDLPELEAQDALEATDDTGPTWRDTVANIRARHIAYAATGAAAVVYPVAFATVVFFLPLVALTVILAIGPRRLGQRYLQRATLIERQYPAEAARMRARLDRVACFWDRVLDLAPTHLAERLALPDVGASRA
ncbi:MAG: hypothetical protein AAGL96_08345 [Pseudomonadota bacterium]